MEEKPPKDVEKPIQEHIYELLRRARVIIISIIVSMLVTAFFPVNIFPGFKTEYTIFVAQNTTITPENSTGLLSSILHTLENSTSEYTPLVFYLMNKMREDILSFQNSTLGKFFGVDKVKVLIIAHGVTSTINVMLKIAFLMGLLLASPIVAYEIYRYVEPALYPHEKKFLLSFILSFTILFGVGSYYSYKIIAPITFLVFLWLSAAPGVATVFSVEQFYDFILVSVFGVGAFFTLPILIYLLVRFEVIEPEVLTKRWREAVVIVTTITAILTPDPTPVTTLLLLAPILSLYGLSVIVAKRAVKKRRSHSPL